MKNKNLKEYKLCDLYKMDSGLNSTKEQAGHGSDFLSFKDIYNNTIMPDELTEKKNTTKEEQNKYSIKKGDIFLTRTSEVIDELAMSSVALKDYPNSTFSGFAKRLRPTQTNITYDKFMAFFLRSKYFRKIINNKAFMTLRASFNDNIFRDIKILIPDYEIQVKIGNLFCNIEYKIRLNNQINNNLEDMMKMLYQRWFLEFEFPNKGGKPYKSSGGQMIWNEEIKREIPETWNIKKLLDIAKVYQPITIATTELEDSGKYFVYGSNGIIGKYNEYNHEENEIAVSCRGNCGQVHMTLPYSWITGNAMVIHPNEKFNYKEYMYYALEPKYLSNLTTGSVQKQITRTNLENYKVIIPNTKLVNKFNDIGIEVRKEIIKNRKENIELTELREYLLPMLMNGQINVDDIEI